MAVAMAAEQATGLAYQAEQLVNNHPRCLHMWWRPIGMDLPRPHPMLVGFKDAGVIA
jgi:hypothetical protein